MENDKETFTAHVGQCRFDLGMTFMAELCQMLRKWLLQHKKFRVTVDYDPDGDAKVEIKSLTSQTTEEDMERLITEYIDVVREQMKKPDASLVTMNDSIRLLERHIHNVKIGAIRISQMED